ncbi:FitA-like ribbon-helix-helix domain-containing protein [Leifsonia poae]|uniref:FitA-like ribbon-helix-helix domain-containing protein n=1 Tax=Leifsonia poae TaxID=110933 RepID=UPI001CBDC565|nr:hypothetical protein [Leifsonia poae]
MTVSITIRSVPDEIRDILAARAARSGRSLQEFLVGELTSLARKPSVDEALAEIRQRAAHYPPVPVGAILSELDAARNEG